MTNLTKTLILLILLAGCSGETQHRERVVVEYTCTAATADKRAAFIVDCMKAGNPVSDEEPEDWIPLCMKKADTLFCETTRYRVKEVRINRFASPGYWREISRERIND